MKKLFCALLAIALLAGCGGNGGSSAGGDTDKDSYKVALHFELTGEVADYGTAELKGAKLALKLANEKAGYTKFVGLEYDDKSDVTESVAVATTIASEKVIGVVGPATSGASAATYEILTGAGIPVVSPSATANNQTLNAAGKVYDYVYRVCFEDSYQGAAMAQFAKDTLGATTAVIYGDSSSDYAKGLANAFTAQFTKLGGTIVDTENYTSGDTDFNAVLTKIKAMNFDVLYIPGYYNEAGLIIKQAIAMGINTTFIGPDGFDSNTLVKLAGAENLNDVYYTTAYTSVGASDLLQAFIDAYTKEYGEEPSMFAALAFDATNTLLQAFDEAGSADGTAVNAKLAAINFSGVTGSFKFDDTHTPVKSVLVVELVNGVQSNAVSVSPNMD